MLEVVAAKRWRFPLVLKSWKNLRVQVSSISDASMVYYQLFVLFGFVWIKFAKYLWLPWEFDGIRVYIFKLIHWILASNGVSTQLDTEVPTLQLSHPPIVALPTHPTRD